MRAMLVLLSILSIVGGEQGVRYLAFVPTQYLDGVRPLIDWHHRQGLETRVIVKSTFTASEIKDSIQQEYNNHTPPKLRWVLLVGDVDRMPTYTGWGVSCSDIWFVDFDLNYRAECSIGRLSCDSNTDLANQVEKILKYEQDPEPGDWLGKAVLISDRATSSMDCKRGIYNYPYPFYRYTMDTLFGGYPGVGNSDVTRAIDEGRNLVNYIGRGSQTSWPLWNLSGENWTTTEISNLNNGDRTPIVFNIAASCGRISHEDCLGEVWLEKYPGGAVASLAASDVSYTTPNLAFDRALFWALGDSTSHGTPYQLPLWDLGHIILFADYYMVMVAGPQGQINYKMYLLLGDPALEVWRGRPEPCQGDHPDLIPTGPQNFIVTLTDTGGQPLRGALVCVWKGSEVYEYDWTDATGKVTFSINPTSPGTLYVTGSPHNYIPYQGYALVTTGVEEQLGAVSYFSLRSHLVTDQITCDYSFTPKEEVRISIYDGLGRKVWERWFHLHGKGRVTIDLFPLKPGIYFINWGRGFEKFLIVSDS